MASPAPNPNTAMDASTPTEDSPESLSETEQARVAAIMTLTESFTPEEINQLRQKMNARQNAKSRLLSLPAELRNRIFEMAFFDNRLTRERLKTLLPDELGKWAFAGGPNPTQEIFRELKPLLYGPSSINACRQLRYEARKLLRLDEIEVCVYSASGEVTVLASTMDLRKEICATGQFWTYLHSSKEVARFYAGEWRMQKNCRCSGTLVFPESAGIMPRSFALWEEMPRSELKYWIERTVEEDQEGMPPLEEGAAGGA